MGFSVHHLTVSLFIPRCPTLMDCLGWEGSGCLEKQGLLDQTGVEISLFKTLVYDFETIGWLSFGRKMPQAMGNLNLLCIEEEAAMDAAVTENLLVCSVHFRRAARGQICPGIFAVQWKPSESGGPTAWWPPSFWTSPKGSWSPAGTQICPDCPTWGMWIDLISECSNCNWN